MKKGNNYAAITTSLARLQKKPSDEKAQVILQNAHPLFVIENEQKINGYINSFNPLKWEKVQEKYQLLNRMNNKIRLVPIATSLISDIRSYDQVIYDTDEKIMQARYKLGMDNLNEGTRTGAIEAHRHLSYILKNRANYKDTKAQLKKAEEIATIIVGLYPIPMSHLKYELSARFFETQLYQYINNQNKNRFIRFVLPSNLSFEKIAKDHIVEIRFDEFSIGSSYIKETVHQRQRDSIITKEVQVGDTTAIAYLDAEAEVNCFSKEIKSNGVLDLKIIGTFNGSILTNEKFKGTYLYLSNWGSYNGNKEALTETDKDCLKNKRERKDPSSQVLFKEFTQALFGQVSDYLEDYYSSY